MRNVKKILAVLFGTIVVIAAGGIAFAFWTTTGGTGEGTADTGESAGVTVNQTTTVDAMGPGVAPQNLSGDFDNNGDAAVVVTTVTAAIGSVAGGAGTCAADNYDITNAVSTVGASVPVGDGVGSWGTTDIPKIAFVNDPAVNQDGCQGATVTIEYTVG